MKAEIIYASLTGNNEEIAEIIQNQLREHHVDTNFTEIGQADAFDLPVADLIVIVPYTYGEGDLPEEGLDFFDDLQDVNLSGTVFGVAGSGDRWYAEDYCKAVVEFDHQLETTGATRGVQPLFIDLHPEDADEQRLDDFTTSLIKTATQLGVYPMIKTRRRGYGILLLTTLALIGLMLVALSLGRYQLSLSELIATLTGQASVSPVIHNIVFSLRLPRILAAAAIGAALAISGDCLSEYFSKSLSFA